MVDEWGTWWDVEPGTIPGHLFQQNTMRDAFVAALTLHVFHKYTDRVKMANIAQIVNVLQSMILTKGKDMVLTPTYHVFEMYKVHQDATFLPMDLNLRQGEVRRQPGSAGRSASASRDSQGKIQYLVGERRSPAKREHPYRPAKRNDKERERRILQRPP